MEEVVVRYVGFPGILKGIMGFYHYKGDAVCAEPHHRYDHSEVSGGFCHTNSPEQMDFIAKQVGAMTRGQFIAQHHKDAWINDYGNYLSRMIGEQLENGGIEFKEENVRFICPKDEFQVWIYGGRKKRGSSLARLFGGKHFTGA